MVCPYGHLGYEATSREVGTREMGNCGVLQAGEVPYNWHFTHLPCSVHTSIGASVLQEAA